MARQYERLPAMNGRTAYCSVRPAPAALREGNPVDEQNPRARFESTFLPHVDAAYNLARWLIRDDHHAEDVVQDAFLRAYRSFGGFQGGDGRAWFLAVVRNSCRTWLKRHRSHSATSLDEIAHTVESDAPDPAAQLMQSARRQAVHRALADLPVEYREVVVLRELEGLSYKEIAAVAGVPIGTVMSRLARGRQLLREQMSGAGLKDS